MSKKIPYFTITKINTVWRKYKRLRQESYETHTYEINRYGLFEADVAHSYQSALKG
jgi:hypothetical protein